MTVPILVDSHSHFDDDSFAIDRIAALARAEAVGVTRQIIPGVCAAWWPRIDLLCQEYSTLYPAYGIHPLYLAEHQTSHLDVLAQQLTMDDRVVAVGECGLDYYVQPFDKKEQLYFFHAQLSLAQAAQLPIIVHARRSVDDVIQCIRQVPGIRGVIHSFSGSEVQARRLLELGFYLSFGGPITYPGAHRQRKLVQSLPLESILLETDSPDQPLVTHRGIRNEPAFLPEILNVMAELRQQDPLEIANITTDNAFTLFSISP